MIQQAAELRAYLKSKGAEISEENSEGGLHVDLAQIIEACDVCLKEDDKGLFLIFCIITNHQFSSVAQSVPTLCDPMNRSTPGLPVHHQLPEFTQTHAHRVGDAIQPSHPLSSPSPLAPNPSQHQGLFQ